jgi:lipid II:glycine glycyltransferase (peptidoglycan interpeptide bridge formation enzyme)
MTAAGEKRPLEVDALAWDRLLARVSYSNVRQTSEYRQALGLYGHESELLAIARGGELAAGALLDIRRPIPGLPAALHTSGGILLPDSADRALLRELLDALLERAGALGAVSLNVALRVPRETDGVVHPEALELESAVREAGFEREEPLETYVVPLDRAGDDALLESFGKNPRRHIRKAIREGVEIRETLEPAAFEAFASAHRAMTGRKGLDALPKGLATQVLLPLATRGHGRLFLADFRGIPRNWLYVASIGVPLYQWGALDAAAREPECPQTGQVLHYGAMCRFRAEGQTRYDFGGTPGAVPDPSHPNFSVWKFKHEFEPSHVRFIGHWSRVLRPAHASLLSLTRRAVSRARAWGRR